MLVRNTGMAVVVIKKLRKGKAKVSDDHTGKRVILSIHP
jgi:hypothetical protein